MNMKSTTGPAGERIAKKAAGKRAGGRQGKPPATAQVGPELDLMPGFRQRLIKRLDQVGVPARGRMAYVASLTYRAVQTVSRWLDERQPGLPDMESCARLCEGLGCSADWMMGLSNRGACVDALDGGEANLETAWVRDVFGSLRGDSVACEARRMAGDEMAPRIQDGDLMFIDRATDKLTGNGLYLLEVDGRVIVRRVESRLGAGLVFKCENAAYEDCVVKDAAAAKRMGLRVIGRVSGAVGVARFWNG